VRGPAVLIAFDFGQRRIGVATGNLLTRTASPLTTVNIGAQLPWQEIDRIIAEWRPQRLVVGQPSGKGAVAAEVARFVEALEQRYGLKVATVDETLTSHAAHSGLREARRAGYLRRKLRKKAELDRHAACLIAEQWLSNQRESPDG
jgi:putative Holliday junction resolvase